MHKALLLWHLMVGRSRSEGYRIIWISVVTAIALAVVLLIVMYPRAKYFVVEAETEYLSLSEFSSGGRWRIDGFSLCNSAGLDDIFADESGGCVPQSLPPEPILEFGRHVEITLLRLGEGDLTIQLANSGRSYGSCNDQEADNATTPADVTASLSSFSGQRPDLSQDFEGVVILQREATGMLPLEFNARAEIGQVPTAGTAGLLLNGRAAYYQSGHFGAARFEADSARLVTGDVVTTAGGDPCVNRRGVIRPAPPDLEGLNVVYLGDSDSIVVDRMSSRYDLAITWTSRFLMDPLSAALFALATVTASIAGAAAFVISGSTPNGERRMPRPRRPINREKLNRTFRQRRRRSARRQRE